MNWLTPFFLNPGIAAAGLALVAVPIVIHLINRLRYRKVRFAAMDFLLRSDRRNRRRVLLEQLLLLALRIAAVLLITALIGRFMLDAAQLTMFRGAQVHHVVLLDDSGSTRDAWAETSAFEEAKEIVRRMISEGASQPGSQKITLIRASRPQANVGNLTERVIDEPLVDEAASFFEDLQASHQRIDWVEAVEAVQQRLGADQSSVKHLHIVSDFRAPDWDDASAIVAGLRAIEREGTGVNLVRTVPAAHENLAITGLTAEATRAAVGVSVPHRVELTNFGERPASEVRAAIFLDGQRLPLNLVFSAVEPGQTVTERFEIVFNDVGQHQVTVTLDPDALTIDNERYVGVEVPEENPVLIVDGDPSGDHGQFIADALAADRSVTGLSASVVNVDTMRRLPLENYHAIFFVNVPEIPPDALDALQRYAEAGGGVAWFLGDAIRPDFYNDKLYAEGEGLFPVRLERSPETLPRQPSASRQPDLVVGDHPLFAILSGEENPFIDQVTINHYLAADEASLEPSDADAEDAAEAAPSVRPIAHLRNGDPVIFEHQYGAGRVVSMLTSAGPIVGGDGLVWNNWAGGPGAPSFAVFVLELHAYIARNDQLLPQETVGTPIELTLNPAYYRDEVEIITPDDGITQLRAERSEQSPEDENEDAVAPLSAQFRETDQPGYYRVQLTSQGGELESRMLAYNVPNEEGVLTLATDDVIRRQFGDESRVRIQPAGELGWISTEDAGQEMRQWLLILLIVVLLAEQAMAYRLSYHQ